MAKAVMALGGWYIAYEIASTALVVGAVTVGFRFTGL